MRNKPTIIAFKTPSLENARVRKSVDLSLSKIFNQKDAEEGVVATISQDSKYQKRQFLLFTFQSNLTCQSDSAAAGGSEEEEEEDAVNFPVGKPLVIYIDGPYGAPSSHIFRAQHAVLIGTGIGVTPFASILQSIMHRYWKARHECPKCHYEFSSEIPQTIMHLRKVDFFWINRDQRSFEWFVNLLSQLEIEQAELGGAMERFLDMHMYITSALQKNDMKAVSLQLALDLLHEKVGRRKIA